MKFSCAKQTIMEAINTVKNAVSTKSTLIILEGILIKTTESMDGLILIGNDQEIGIEYTCEATIDEPGSIVLNARLFGDIVRSLPEAKIDFTMNQDNTITIESDNSKFTLNTSNADAFPAIESITPEKTLVVKQGILKNMIQRTAFAISIDETKKALTGSLLECKGNELFMVALDNKKMALRKAEVEEEHDIKIIIPGKAVKEIAKILIEGDEEVTIYTANHQIMFEMEHCKLFARLIQMEYANYNNIISNNHVSMMKVDKKAFYDAVKRSSLLTIEDNKFPIIVNLKENQVLVYSASDKGSSREIIEVEMDGQEVEMAFNPVYLLDTLNAIEDDFVDIFFVTEFGPCIIRPIEGEQYVYLIAAVRK